MSSTVVLSFRILAQISSKLEKHNLLSCYILAFFLLLEIRLISSKHIYFNKLMKLSRSYYQRGR